MPSEEGEEALQKDCTKKSELEVKNGTGLGEVDGIWGRVAVIWKLLKSLQAKAPLSVFSVFMRVPCDTSE